MKNFEIINEIIGKYRDRILPIIEREDYSRASRELGDIISQLYMMNGADLDKNFVDFKVGILTLNYYLNRGNKKDIRKYKTRVNNIIKNSLR